MSDGQSDVVAWLALIASVIAAGFTWYTAFQAKRQADAVLGDLPPVLSLYQPKERHSADFAKVVLEIVNHNRRPLYVDQWNFDFPEGMRIFQEHDDERQTMFALFDAVKYGTRDFTFDLPLRIAGSSAREPAPVETATFTITTNDSKGPLEPLDVSVTLWYRFEGDDHPIEEKRSITWRPKPVDE